MCLCLQTGDPNVASIDIRSTTQCSSQYQISGDQCGMCNPFPGIDWFCFSLGVEQYLIFQQCIHSTSNSPDIVLTLDIYKAYISSVIPYLNT